MSEPTAIACQFKISEVQLNRFLKSKQVVTQHWFTPHQDDLFTLPQYTVSQWMAELLYSCCHDTQNIFLLHYRPEKQALFFAYILNHGGMQHANAVLSVMHLASGFQDDNSSNLALIFSLTSEDFYAGFEFQNGQSLRQLQAPPSDVLKEYVQQVWSFYDKKSECFPEPAVAIRKRNYFYKPLVAAYKKYLKVLEEQEKPAKIQAATQEQPYHLFDYLYTWQGRVYHLLYGNNPAIELMHADPFTLRKVGAVYADKEYVYACHFDNILNNAYWPVQGIDGASYKLLGGNSKEYVYTQDKHHVYFKENKLAQADVTSFQYLDFAYGKDKHRVYFRDKIIPIDPHNYSIDKHGFIKDANHIFHYGTSIPMHAPTFQVLQYESDLNPFMGVFVLKDQHACYQFDSLHQTFHSI